MKKRLICQSYACDFNDAFVIKIDVYIYRLYSIEWKSSSMLSEIFHKYVGILGLRKSSISVVIRLSSNTHHKLEVKHCQTYIHMNNSYDQILECVI